MDKVELEMFEKLSSVNYKRWMIPLVDNFFEVTKLKSGTVLDLACGPGLLTKELATRTSKIKIYALDYSKFAIKLGKKNCAQFKNTEFKVGDAYNLPYPDNYFNAIICKDSFHHFNKPLAALKEIMRTLKPGGILYLQDLRRDLPSYLIKKATPPDTLIKKLQYYSARAAYTKSEVMAFFKKIGLANATITTRKLDKVDKERYNKLGVSPKTLIESFQSRFVAVAKK